MLTLANSCFLLASFMKAFVKLFYFKKPSILIELPFIVNLMDIYYS